MKLIYTTFFTLLMATSLMAGTIKATKDNNWKYNSTWNRQQVAVVLGAGNSALVNKYTYTDKNITEAVVYYRIRQVDMIDMNGVAFYSAISFLRNNETSQVTNIFASSNKTITIDFNSDVKDNVSIQLINMGGKVIVRKDLIRLLTGLS